MITVLAGADRQDMDFWSSLTRILSRNFSLVQTQGNRLATSDGGPPLVLSDMESFESVRSDGVIILYKDVIPLTATLQGAGQIIAVVDSSNNKLLEHVSSTKLPAITCGLLCRDTITLSSMDTDSAVIDIRRAITGLDGSVIEPSEIPVSLTHSMDSYLLMAAAAVFLLTGNTKKLLKGKL